MTDPNPMSDEILQVFGQDYVKSCPSNSIDVVFGKNCYHFLPTEFQDTLRDRLGRVQNISCKKIKKKSQDLVIFFNFG